MMRKLYLLLILYFPFTSLIAQDLLSELSQSSKQEKEPVFQTFKGSRVVNGHSIETKGKGELEFIITHRFGKINSGAYEFFGLDGGATIRLGLEYGLTSKLGIGIGRSSLNKIYDLYLKYKAVQQSTGGGSPVTITLLGSGGIQTRREVPSGPNPSMDSSLYYSAQALIARKFSSRLSLQVTPVLVHTNVYNLPSNQFAVGFGGRFKVTKSIAINAEYYYRANPRTLPKLKYYDCFGLGIDIETGGHVFQLVFSNTPGMVDRTFIGETNGDFFNGDINFGFNITRTFQLGKQKK